MTWAVIGSGLAGVSAALSLQAQGHEVVIHSLGPGRVSSFRPSQDYPLWRIETGAPSVTHRARSVFDLASRVGLGAPGEGAWRPMAPHARDRYVADGHRLRPVGVGTLGLRQAAEFGAGMLRHRPPKAEESVADWARAQFGNAVANGLARALTVGVWGCGPEQVGFADAWPELARALADGSPLAVQKRLSAEAGPVSAVGAGTWALVEGMGSLRTAALHAFERAGGAVVKGEVTELDDVQADGVVIATDAADAARLLETECAEAAGFLASVLHSPMAVVHWLAEPQERPRGFGFLVPPGDSVLGTLFMSDLRDDIAPRHLRAYTTMIGGLARPEWVDRPEEELIDEVVSRHGRWFGAEPKLRANHVVRWPRAVSIPAVGHRLRMASAKAALLGTRYRLAGSYLAGGTLDDAVQSGVEAGS